jgi:hypothetical protein
MESHQATKLDISGTAKAVISCFQKLGVSFDMNEVLLKKYLQSINCHVCFFPNHTCDASPRKQYSCQPLNLAFLCRLFKSHEFLEEPCLFLLINGFLVKKCEKSNASFIPAFADWCFRTLN